MRLLDVAAQAAQSVGASVGIVPSACSRSHGSGCTLCLEACPHDAITVGGSYEAPAVDPHACIACGACAVACPCNAFANMGASPRQLVAAASQTSGDMRIRCSQVPGSDSCEIGVTCLAGLHPETLIAAAYQLRGGELILSRSDCARCPLAAGARVEHVVHATAELAAALPTPPAIHCDIATEREGHTGAGSESRQRHRSGPTEPVTSAKISRRELLFGLLSAGSGGASAHQYVSGAASAPRAVYLAALAHPFLPAPVAQEGCTGCAACSAVCPTDALAWAAGSSQRILFANAAACLACGECVRVCPEHVLTLPARWVAGQKYSTVAVRQITAAPVGRCEECGDQLEPGCQGVCHRCAVRHDLGADIWAHLGR
ncbi:MAG: 4Fe-4S binding protein [Ancrocorticia sp.]|jgi:ferredoxin|nr:4Fe-4S binding protein [Ancrocorticia sp.]MCI2192722.1 4Fe-4S binding protein [Ancrocorticia sp.]MCI2198378.1 4Fe-4S binding protein [Ancrocorticia sp.]